MPSPHAEHAPFRQVPAPPGPPHAVPSGLLTVTHIPPAVTSQSPGSWQALAPGHVLGAPVQTPALQASLRVQMLSSLHEVPLGFGGLEQPPGFVQVPATWQLSEATHVTGAPVHVPA